MDKIKAVNISKKYKNQSIFEKIDISFHSGEIIGIVGENGSGKTTFIKILCGLIYPETGQVFINGIDNQKNRIKCMQNLGVLLDGTRSVYWRLSVLQNFIYFCGLKQKFGDEVIKMAESIFKKLDLWDIQDQKVETLSYGMKQRLAFACSIAHSPSIILLDEPTTALDSHSTSILERILKNFSDEGKTIVISSHDHEMIRRVSHKAYKIENGSFNYFF